MTQPRSHPGPTADNGQAPAAIILAAGLGKRMGSDLPKVLHEVGDRPMVAIVVDACRAAGCGRIIVVVGQGGRLVRLALAGSGVEFAEQPEQHGTGHAVQCAEGQLRSGPVPRDVFVLCGDGPLIRASTLRALRDLHERSGADATLATALVDDPTGYGRIVRDAAGRFSAIVEHKALAPEQKAVREVNPSYYLFRTQKLLEMLPQVQRSGAGEYYLTDVPGLILAGGGAVELVEAVPPEDTLSINTPAELAKVDAIYRRRAAEGVA